MQGNYADETALGEEALVSLADILSTQEFWIGVSFTVAVIGIVCLLKGRTYRSGGGR